MPVQAVVARIFHHHHRSDDGEMHKLARVITAELKAKGSQMLVYILGWNTLEERISEDDEARKAFDPSFGPFSARILDNTEALLARQGATRSSLTQVQATLTQLTATFNAPPGDATIAVNVFEAHLDAEIDSLRDLANAGKPRTALPLWRGFSRAWSQPPRAAFSFASRPISASASSCQNQLPKVVNGIKFKDEIEAIAEIQSAA